MLRNWMKLLPYFIVEWAIKRHGEKYYKDNKKYVVPFKGVKIELL